MDDAAPAKPSRTKSIYYFIGLVTNPFTEG